MYTLLKYVNSERVYGNVREEEDFVASDIDSYRAPSAVSLEKLLFA